MLTEKDQIWFGLIILTSFVGFAAALIVAFANMDHSSKYILLIWALFMILPSLYIATEVASLFRKRNIRVNNGD